MRRKHSCLGFLAAAVIILTGSDAANGAEGANVDLSGLVRITATAPALKPLTGTYDSLVSLTNISAKPIYGPVFLVVKGYSARGVTLVNADGRLPLGRYAGVRLPTGVLAPRQSIGTVVLKFSSRTAKRFSFTTAVLSGSGTKPPANLPPVANAGEDRTGAVGSTLILDGSGSSDPDGNLISFAWQLLRKPAGSAATLSAGDGPRPGLAIDLAGRYEAQLVVSDGKAQSFPDWVVIDTHNSRPTADAGAPAAATTGVAAALDGRGSHDPDGDGLRYRWSLPVRPAGSVAAIGNPRTARSRFIPDKPGGYVARLVVSDEHGESDPAAIAVSTVNAPPVANAGPDRADLPMHQPFDLDGSASWDPEGKPLRFRWSLIFRPAGSAAQLQSVTAATTITPDVPGEYIVQLLVSDGALKGAPDTVRLSVRNRPPEITSTPGTQATAGRTYQYQAQAADPDGDAVTFSLTASPAGMTIDPASGLVGWTPQAAQVGTHPVGVRVEDAWGGFDTQSYDLSVSTVAVPSLVGLTRAAAEAEVIAAGLIVGTVATANSDIVPPDRVISQDPAAGASVAPGSPVNLLVSLGPPELPPDPGSIAPPIDPTVATSVSKSTEFLYTGTNPIQTGVAPGTIELKRAAVIRGRVLDKQDNPLPGVTLSILNHPELGRTLSRSDGMFDMAVNGGALLTVRYEKSGHLPAQRQLDAPLQDFARLPDVVLIPLDARVTTIDLTSSAAMQVARGTVQTDEDGSRQATLFIPQGTRAQMVMPDGSTQSLTSLNIRATEYTVGSNGPQSMPAPLPPESGYTYAVELSLDEAIAGGARTVLFSQPVFHYVENFLNFPVGGIVPVGYYDREKAAWIPSENGRVIEILSISGAPGMAELDTDGDGAVDSGASLGVTDAERQQIASLYAAGQTLWRVPITHFSPWDFNWPYGPPDDAETPSQPDPDTDEPDDEPDCIDGSIIECQNQTLREAVAVTGTPFTLHYTSGRVRGHNRAYDLNIPLSGASVPASLRQILLIIDVAGQHHEQQFPGAPSQKVTFAWDGKDAYGRSLVGSQPVAVRIGYVYQPVYRTPAQLSSAFGRFGSSLTRTATRQQVILWQQWRGLIGNVGTASWSLGGWSLNVHHVREFRGLHLGGGGLRKPNAYRIPLGIFAGTGIGGYGGDGGPAGEAQLGGPQAIAVGPDGSLFIGDVGYDIDNRRIRRVGPDGVITTVAGGGNPADGLGDGGPATQARLAAPFGIAVGPDGSLFIADTVNIRIRRVGPDGIITTVAGGGDPQNYPGDGGPATATVISDPYGIAVGPDGSFFFAEPLGSRVRRVGPDGIISTVAGRGGMCATSPWTFCGDGGPAGQAVLNAPYGVALGPDGSLFIADTGNSHIRRVAPDGIMTSVAGSFNYGNLGEGGPASAAWLTYPYGVAVGPDGSLFIVDPGEGRIRRVSQNWIITTVAGGGNQEIGGPATDTLLSSPTSVAVGRDGTLFIAEQFRILKSLAPLSEALVSNDGSTEAYAFSASGQHLRTHDAFTGAERYVFAYDGAGRLISVADGDGNMTVVERDGFGNPTAILAPFGQRTALTTGVGGYLTSIVNPAGETHRFTYSDEGLMMSHTDPRGNVHGFEYNARGRLIRDTDPAGGFTTLSATKTGASSQVTVTTALGRSSSYQVERLSTGDLRKTNTSAAGAQTVELIKTDARRSLTLPDGTTTAASEGPDPIFGMQAPVVRSREIRSPGGLTATITTQRTAALADPADPLSLTQRTETVSVNGRSFSNAYNGASKTFTLTTPAGRGIVQSVNSQGRPLSLLPDPSSTPMVFSYDIHGRPSAVNWGTEQISYAYDGLGRIISRTDAAGNQDTHDYDAADRLIQSILPSGRTYRFAYDASGNFAQVTMPSGAVHALSYTPIDQEAAYTLPGGGTYSRSYSTDREPARVVLPSGRTIDRTYDGGGRLLSVRYPEGVAAFSYAQGDPTRRVSRASFTPQGGGSTEDVLYQYDGPLLTRKTITGTANGQFSYSYDSNFFLVGSTLVSGSDTVQTTLARDADGLLTAQGPFTLTRNGPAGAVSGISGGTLVGGYTYDGLLRLTSRTHAVSGQQVYRIELAYDNVGRIVRKTEAVAGTTHTRDYAYDVDGQLVRTTIDGTVAESYGYDVNGNRTSRVLPGGTVETAVYDAQDRLLQRGTISHQFDADGFLVQRGSDSFAYSARGELLQATVGGQTITYAYDGTRRVARSDASGTWQYLYGNPGSPFELTAARDPSGVLIAFHYDPEGNLFALDKGGVRYYVATDHAGTPRVVADAAGQVVKAIDHDSFGVVISDSNPAFDLPIGFAGGLADTATGLVRFGFRDYDPASGRWTAKDPIFFAGGQSNLYGYVANDPVGRKDPSGLQGRACGAWRRNLPPWVEGPELPQFKDLNKGNMLEAIRRFQEMVRAESPIYRRQLQDPEYGRSMQRYYDQYPECMPPGGRDLFNFPADIDRNDRVGTQAARG